MFLVKAFSGHRFLCLDNFLLVVVVFSVLTIWVICSEFGIYCIKEFGDSVQGKVEKIEKIANNHLEIAYSYQVGTKKYTGHHFYRSTTRYKREEIAELIRQIERRQIYPVYYKPKQPEKAVCFITHENLSLNKSLFIALLCGWGIWGLGYLQAWIWDKN